MKAASISAYGPAQNLRFVDLPLPEVGNGQLRVRVIASSVTSGDTRIRGFKGAGLFRLPLRLMMGLFRPRQQVPGMDYAGIVDEVHPSVTEFKTGDAVFGIGLNRANAEYLTVKATSAICLKPQLLSFQEAASLPFGGLSALVFVRDIAKARPGERLLVYGASGAVGTALVQIGKAMGLLVTAVCSRRNRELVESLGADTWLDYVDLRNWDHVLEHDIVIDTIGVTDPRLITPILSPAGRHVYVTHVGWRPLFWAIMSNFRRSKRVICGFSGTNKADLLELSALVQAHKIQPIIDRVFALSDIVKAHLFVETGRKVGAVIVDVGGNQGCG
jgi:NADPH:quinone reductase-like Zn-dependent oxidoreductase